MEKLKWPTVVVTEDPPLVESFNNNGGRHRTATTEAGLVAQTASALMRLGFTQRRVMLIAPARIRQKLVEQGFEF